MDKYLFTFSIIVFVGSALGLELFFAKGRIRNYSKALFLLTLIYIIFAFTDIAAHRWLIWDYGATKSMNYRFLGVEVETYFFVVGTGLAVSLAAIYWAQAINKGRPMFPSKIMKSNKPKARITKHKK